MKTIGGATKVLGDMAGGKAAFDAAAAEAAKAALVAASLDIEAKLTPTTTDPGQAASLDQLGRFSDQSQGTDRCRHNPRRSQRRRRGCRDGGTRRSLPKGVPHRA